MGKNKGVLSNIFKRMASKGYAALETHISKLKENLLASSENLDRSDNNYLKASKKAEKYGGTILEGHLVTDVYATSAIAGADSLAFFTIDTEIKQYKKIKEAFEFLVNYIVNEREGSIEQSDIRAAVKALRKSQAESELIGKEILQAAAIKYLREIATDARSEGKYRATLTDIEPEAWMLLSPAQKEGKEALPSKIAKTAKAKFPTLAY